MEGKDRLREWLTSMADRLETEPAGDPNDWGAPGAEPPRQQTIADLQAVLKKKYPFRFARLQADMRWLEKKHKKLGIPNPEDVRWLV